MKAHLLYPDQNMAWRSALETTEIREKERSGHTPKHAPSEPPIALPWNAEALERDLNLGTLFDSMAGNDELICIVARTIILNAMGNDTETIHYRQAVLQDCLDHADTVRKLYDLAVDSGEKAQQQYLSLTLSRHPDWMLRHSITVLKALLDPIKRIRKVADSHADDFSSEGWKLFFAGIREQLSDERLVRMQRNLTELQLRDGVLMSARLGPGNKGADYTLLSPPRKSGGRFMQYFRRRFPRFFDRAPSGTYDFVLDPRDEGGARALQDVKNRGIAIAADSVGEAADHVRDFFAALRCELAFYVGCLNLYDTLSQAQCAFCMPTPQRADPHYLGSHGVYDVCLALAGHSPVIGNDLDTNGKNPIIVTGANQGGKSTFLRSIGLAQLMMQAGMLVAAESFESSICDGLYTHFKREEDAGLKSGKLEEELARMSEIVEHFPPHPLILCNESFAATNEREGSEIARQVSTALLERSIRLIYVTHLYEFAQAMYETESDDVLFLRADRQADGTRTYKIVTGEPLQTSFGEDLYARIFSQEEETRHDVTNEVQR
ncbi:MAG: MutS-related protein [Gammaproteobacteria bacterium]